FQAEDGIRDGHVTGVQTCALPILNGREKSGKNAVGSLAAGPAATVIAWSFASSACIPPTASTAYQAMPMTMAIFNTNWKRSVHKTPHKPPSVTYKPVNGIRTKTQINFEVDSLNPRLMATIAVIALVTHPRIRQFISKPR